jgi:hypothetical protein
MLGVRMNRHPVSFIAIFLSKDDQAVTKLLIGFITRFGSKSNTPAGRARKEPPALQPLTADTAFM